MTVRLERFRPAHLTALKQWGEHDDARLQNYDFKGFADRDYSYWYRRKQGWIFHRLYAIMDDSLLVGFMTLKEINWWSLRGAMGIVIDPARLSRGYGSRATALFLEMVLRQKRFACVRLKVAAFNRRAMRVYLKNGFQIVNTRCEPYEIQSNNFAIIMQDDEHFTMREGVLYTTVHTMEIRREHYINR